MRDRLVLVDGNHLAWRNHWKLKNLRSPGGKLSGAYYGTLRSLRKILIQKQPARMVVFFDGGRSERTSVDETYKANRDGKHDDIRKAVHAQIRNLEGTCASLGLPVVRIKGFETDSVIAACADNYLKYREVWSQLMIVSSDKDFYQLIDKDRVVCYDENAQVHMNEMAFCKKYPGILPYQHLYVKAVMGDGSDGIKGLKGYGPKRALALVASLNDFTAWLMGDARELSSLSKHDSRIVERNIRLMRLPPNEEEFLESWHSGEVRKAVTLVLDPQPADVLAPFYSDKTTMMLLKIYRVNSILGDFLEWRRPFLKLYRSQPHGQVSK